MRLSVMDASSREDETNLDPDAEFIEVSAQESLRELLTNGAENGIKTGGEESVIPFEMWEGREQQLFKTCLKYTVQFCWPQQGETPAETKARREEMQRKCKAARQRQKRLEMSPELRDTLRARQAERMRIKRSQMSAEERRVCRQQAAEKGRLRRKNLSPQELGRIHVHRAKAMRETRKKSKLQKLKEEGSKTMQSAIAAGLNFDDLKLLQSHDFDDDIKIKVINVVMGENVCKNCGNNFKEITCEQKTNHTMPSSTRTRTLKVFNFGHAPTVVAHKFQKFYLSYNSLSEALLDLLEKERLLCKKYRFMPEQNTQKVLAMSTNEDYSDVLETTIQAMKELTKNCKYTSVANTIEELLFSNTSNCEPQTSVDNPVGANELSQDGASVKVEDLVMSDESNGTISDNSTIGVEHDDLQSPYFEGKSSKPRES